MAKECQNLLNPILNLPDYLYIFLLFIQCQSFNARAILFPGGSFRLLRNCFCMFRLFPYIGLRLLDIRHLFYIIIYHFFESSFCNSSSNRMLLNKKLLVSKYQSVISYINIKFCRSVCIQTLSI